ncbi:peptidase inhibitor family I36 protein [Nitratireductor luteus]|uniref:peptidase inhibitor family I36 protein n=1 Tax=Nitratireductor luteus TaxID=2976980 RepID=UPI0022403690|nr:peptidase inhibitor family I36 protein [Nitratireductor luteus]
MSYLIPLRRLAVLAAVLAATIGCLNAAEAAPAVWQGDRPQALNVTFAAPGDVCFFEHRGFQGRYFCARTGQASRLVSRDWNDRVSSISVGRGARVVVCEHRDFGGWCDEYRDDVVELFGNRNDAISSFRIDGRRPGGGRPDWEGPGWGGGPGWNDGWDGYRPRPPRSQVCFYEHRDFRGASFCARPGEASWLVPPAWNDRISSIRITGWTGVAVCEHKNFGGWCTEYNRDVPYVGDQRNDQISSFQVFR